MALRVPSFLRVGVLTLVACAAMASPESAGGRAAMTAARGRLDHVDRWSILLARAPGAVSKHQPAPSDGDMIVLNEAPHRRSGASAGAPPILIAYLSVGEAETSRPYWRDVRGRSFVIETNPAWTGNVRVDIRDRRWQEILLAQEAPRLLAQGFDGFMLDTLDTAPYLERRDPIRFAGSRQALCEFLATFRRTFPTVVLLANGTDTLVDAAPYVDGFVTEGIFATHDDAGGGYRATTDDERVWRLAQIRAALDRLQRPVFSIEYAAANDDALGRWATQEGRAHGFRPFVTSKNLDRPPSDEAAQSRVNRFRSPEGPLSRVNRDLPVE